MDLCSLSITWVVVLLFGGSITGYIVGIRITQSKSFEGIRFVGIAVGILASLVVFAIEFQILAFAAERFCS